MSFVRPQLIDIIGRVKADVKRGLGITTILRRSFLNVLVRAIAGVSHLLHGHLDFISKQVFWDTAEQEFLRRWLSLFGVKLKIATFTQLRVKFFGNVGAIIPANTQLQRTDGAIYKTNQEVVIPNAAAAVTEVSTITTIPDVNGSLNKRYFLLHDASGSVAVWFDIDNSGAAMPDAAARADRAIKISTINEDTDAVTVAQEVQKAVDSDLQFSAVLNGNVVTVTHATPGDRPDIDAGDSRFIVEVLTQGKEEIIAGEITVVATAETPGSFTNFDTGESLNLVSPRAGVESLAIVHETVIEGEDQELDESARSRLIDRIQNPPSGGDVNDYKRWAKEVPGITRAWVFPNHLGPGTVGVSFVQDDEANIIPDVAKVQEVQDYIEEHYDPNIDRVIGKPVTAEVFVFAPIPKPLNPIIKLKPNTQEVRKAVTGELRDLIFRDANPGNAYKGPMEKFDGTLLFSRINEAISIAVGEEDHELAAPLANVTVNTGELITLGSITWQTL